MEAGTNIVIDASNSKIIDHVVIEVIRDFTINAKRRNIGVEVIGIPTISTADRISPITEPARA